MNARLTRSIVCPKGQTATKGRAIAGFTLLIISGSLMIDTRVESLSVNLPTGQIGFSPRAFMIKSPKEDQQQKLFEGIQQEEQEMDMAGSGSHSSNDDENKMKIKQQNATSGLDQMGDQLAESYEQRLHVPELGEQANDYQTSLPDRRFGLFKKNQASQSNGILMSQDCERCLNRPINNNLAHLDRPVGSSQFYYEPAAYFKQSTAPIPSQNYYQPDQLQLIGTAGNQQPAFGSKLKSKLNSKFPFSKPSFSDIFQGNNKFPSGKQSLGLKFKTGSNSNSFVMPLASVMPIKYQQPYYCMQQSTIPYPSEPLVSSLKASNLIGGLSSEGRIPLSNGNRFANDLETTKLTRGIY